MVLKEVPEVNKSLFLDLSVSQGAVWRTSIQTYYNYLQNEKQCSLDGKGINPGVREVQIWSSAPSLPS